MSTFAKPCLGVNGRRCPNNTRNPGSRCDTCRSAWNIARGSSTARGYGSDHKALRAQWAPKVSTGMVTCARCGLPIQRHEPWDLGHSDDRASYRGPEHADCNRGGRPRQLVDL